MKLNIGSADRHFDGYKSVDRVWQKCDDFQLADLSGTWPWSDSSIEEVLALDIVEHIPNRIHLMNELHRILIPGGIAVIETPNASRGAGFFQDPTHCSPWVLNSFQYYEHGSFATQRLAASYGITARFKIDKLYETECKDVHEMVWKIHARLVAVK